MGGVRDRLLQKAQTKIAGILSKIEAGGSGTTDAAKLALETAEREKSPAVVGKMNAG